VPSVDARASYPFSGREQVEKEAGAEGGAGRHEIAGDFVPARTAFGPGFLLDLTPVPERPKEPLPYNDRPTKEGPSPGR